MGSEKFYGQGLKIPLKIFNTRLQLVKDLTCIFFSETKLDSVYNPNLFWGQKNFYGLGPKRPRQFQIQEIIQNRSVIRN